MENRGAPSLEFSKSNLFSSNVVSRTDTYAMVQRQCQDAGIKGKYSCHSFRATGITSYLENGGDLEKAQHIAGHADSRTSKIYDRRGQKTTLEDMERIRYKTDRPADEVQARPEGDQKPGSEVLPGFCYLYRFIKLRAGYLIW